MDKYMEQAIDLFASNWLEKEDVTDEERAFICRLMETDWQVEFAVTRQVHLLESRASELRLLDMLRRIDESYLVLPLKLSCDLDDLLAEYKDVKTEEP
jgi:hypothetical protein